MIRRVDSKFLDVPFEQIDEPALIDARAFGPPRGAGGEDEVEEIARRDC